MTFLLGVIASFLHIIAFAIYNKQVFQQTSVPKTATWTLWAILTVLNASSYSIMSGDLIKSLLPATSSLACIITFLACLYGGKFSWMDKWDGIAFVIGLVSGFVWWRYQSATYANLILQLAVAISFIPTYRGVWNNPKSEKTFPWYLWSTAYVISITVVLLRWQGQYADLVYPVNCLLLHAMVCLLTKKGST